MDQFGTIVAAEPSDGDFSSNEVYTWEFDIDPGTYIFTIYDSYGDGLYDGAGFTITVDGVLVHEFLGSTEDQEDNFEEYQVTFDTEQGWFGITSQTYEENVPFEKGQYIFNEMVQNLTSKFKENLLWLFQYKQTGARKLWHFYFI